MMRDELNDWLHRNTGDPVVWYLKRLSANDTLAGDSNQSGPYIPREFLLSILPELNRPGIENPALVFPLTIDSHPESERSQVNVRAIWYNNSLRGGTRNETRITGFGGAASPMLDPENTGALVVFAFHREETASRECRVWICRDDVDEDLVESRTGAIEPGESRIWGLGSSLQTARETIGCQLPPHEIPAEWLTTFPGGESIIAMAVKSSPPLMHDMDKRLLARRECEFQIFRSIEEAVELPKIRQGFDSIDGFVARAQTVLQRRKSRSGRSLELHAKVIFEEEALIEDKHFEFQPRIEGGKAPDFLFPTANQYDDRSFPAKKLRMLAVKTTCKDRWRQILNEADRIGEKHLLTLQQGVSENQFREMTDAGVKLIVPAPLHSHYPGTVQPHLTTLAEFVGEIKQLVS